MGKSTLDKQKREKTSSNAVTEKKTAGGTEEQTAGEDVENGNPARTKKASDGEALALPRRGAKRVLRHAVKEEVIKESALLAKTLVGKAKEGNVRSTEIMLSLIDHPKKDSRDTQKEPGGFSAENLPPSEPEWDEEMDRVVDLVTAMQK
jgi:hypothetical protein